VPYPMATPEDLAQTVREVEALDRRIIATEADVRDQTAMAAAIDRGVAELGRLDIVAANAGIATNSPAADMPAQTWKDMIDTNLSGVFNSIQPAIPHLINGGRGGAIVITSSAVALRAVPNLSHYASAKNGLIGLMRTLALELAPHSIRVNTLHPTNVDTGMIQNDAIRQLFLPDEEHPTREQSVPIYTTLNALPVPWIDPADVSKVLLFLVSDDARYVTGAEIPIDAGFQLL
jgi:(+)-trans-carveol dehydrogenase